MVDASRARGHQHDAAREECRLVDRMRHEHDGAAELLPQRQQVLLQLVAGEFVERRERFVHQQQARPCHQCAGDRNAHAHPAGELPRTRRLEAVEADALQRFVHLRHRLARAACRAGATAGTRCPQHSPRAAALRPGTRSRFRPVSAGGPRPMSRGRRPADRVRRSIAAASTCRSPTARAGPRSRRRRLSSETSRNASHGTEARPTDSDIVSAHASSAAEIPFAALRAMTEAASYASAPCRHACPRSAAYRPSPHPAPWDTRRHPPSSDRIRAQRASVIAPMPSFSASPESTMPCVVHHVAAIAQQRVGHLRVVLLDQPVRRRGSL